MAKKTGAFISKCANDARLRKPDEKTDGLRAWEDFFGRYVLKVYTCLDAAYARIRDENLQRGPFEFMVTNIPFEASLHPPQNTPVNAFYEMMYCRSLEKLDEISLSLPDMRIIAYSGADEIVRRMAVEEHSVSYAVHKGGKTIMQELDELARAIEIAKG